MAGVPVVIRGRMYRSDRHVGGGPIYPPEEGGGPPGDAHPEHPIVLPPEEPPYPAHPIVIPPGFIDGVHPEHPIVIPPPLTIWGPNDPRPTPPIVIPPEVFPPDARPEHPIVIPPPDLIIWGGPYDPPHPAHPIELPPDGEGGVDPKPMENWDVKTYWTPEGGWAVALVPSESNPGVPTPSGARRK